jgi:hypothetical protein
MPLLIQATGVKNPLSVKSRNKHATKAQHSSFLLQPMTTLYRYKKQSKFELQLNQQHLKRQHRHLIKQIPDALEIHRRRAFTQNSTSSRQNESLH